MSGPKRAGIVLLASFVGAIVADICGGDRAHMVLASVVVASFTSLALDR